MGRARIPYLAQPQAQEITSCGDSVVISEKTAVGSQVCLVTPRERGSPEITDIQAEGRKLMATATTKRNKRTEGSEERERGANSKAAGDQGWGRQLLIF